MSSALVVVVHGRIMGLQLRDGAGVVMDSRRGCGDSWLLCVETMEMPWGMQKAALGGSADAGAAKESHIPGLSHYTSEV